MIYLIRHGETEFNREGRYQGGVDSALTELGLAQARAVGSRLAELAGASPGDWRIQSSPLARARRTAEIIAGAMRLASPSIDDRLVEVSYGALEGMTRPEAEARWPELAGSSSLFGRSPGGESFEALSARVGAWLAEAAGESATVVAVSHAGVIRTLRGLYLGLTLEEIRALDRPQDVIFALADGRIERIEASLAPPPPPG
jgi:broad specificity phosphatase PhoE